VPFLKHNSDDDLEIPSLGVFVPAGHAVEVDVPDGLDLSQHPLLSTTKTKPSGMPTYEPPQPAGPEPVELSDDQPAAPAANDNEES
jgi:hypothetical protein